MASRLSIGQAWSEATAILRAERRLIAPVVLGLLLLPSAVSTMIQPLSVAGTPPPPGPWMIGAGLMLLVMLVGQMTIALIADGWRGSLGEALARGARRLPALVIAGLIVFIPLTFLIGIVLAGATLASGAGEAVEPTRLSGGGAIAVLLALIVVLAVMVRLLPLIVVVARGQDGAFVAIKRTFAMTRGHFWRLLGFLLLSIVALIIVAAAVGAVVGLFVTMVAGAPEPWSVSLLLMALAGGLVQAVGIAIYTVMLTRIAVQLEPSANSGT